MPNSLFGIGLMSLQSTGRSGDKALMRIYYRYLEPTQIAFRKPGRMQWFEITSLDPLPCRLVDLAPWSRDCVDVCAEIVEAHRLYLGKYIFLEGGRIPKASRLRRGIPLVVDLDCYRDFESYAKRLRRRRKEIEKAGQRGFYSKPFNRHFRRRELFEIETSLRFRSGGPVLAAFFARAPEPSPAEAVGTEPDPPACPLHWYSDWGVFAPANADTAHDRLVGYLFLKRVGNTVRLTAIMGHGGWLRHDIVKLLFADTMRWLLDREDPAVHGVRHLHYGAIEHGGIGLAAWKKRFLFEPVVFSWRDPKGIAHRCTAIIVYLSGLIAM